MKIFLTLVSILLMSINSLAKSEADKSMNCMREIALRAYTNAANLCLEKTVSIKHASVFLSKTFNNAYKFEFNENLDLVIKRNYSYESISAFLEDKNNPLEEKFLVEELDCAVGSRGLISKTLLKDIKSGDVKIQHCDDEFPN